MFRIIIALVLLFVTGLLTVTDVVSVSLADPVFILFSPILFLSVLIVLVNSYVYSVDFVRRIVALHDFYEFHNSRTPGFKSYSDWYVLALLQIGGELVRQKLENIVFGWCQSLSYKVSKLIDHIITSPLANARSRLQPYRDALPYSTSRIVLALVCLAYLAFYVASLALRYAVGKLAGLALSLYSACTPTSVGLSLVIVSISAYSFREPLARCGATKHLESIYWALRMGLLLEFDELYDKDHDFIADPEPEPEPEVVCANAGYLPDLDERQRYLQVTEYPPNVPPPETPSPVHNEVYTGVAAGFRPRPQFNLVRLRYEESLRMQEASRQCQVKPAAKKGFIDYRFVPQPTRISSSSGIGRIDQRWKSTPPGVASTPIEEILGSMSLKDNQNTSSTATGPLLHPENTASSPGQPIDPLATSSATSSAASSPSHGSLPDLVPDTDTSDTSSELNTSSDERCDASTIIRSAPKGSQMRSRRVRGLITRPQPKSSPLYAPKEIVDAQVAGEEDKVAAVLHRSQWKQKQKWWTASKKQAKKARAPSGIRSCSPVADPMDATAVGTETSRRGGEEELVDAMVESRGASNTEGVTPIWSPVVSPSPAQVSYPVPSAVDVQAAMAEKPARVRKIKEVPRRKAGPSQTVVTMSDATTAAPTELVTRYALTSGSPVSVSRTNDSEASDQMPPAPTHPMPAVMTPGDLAAAMNEKVKKVGGTRKVRFVPVYTLLDKERTVVKKGERIPPHTQYHVKDANGTSLRMTGSKWVQV